MTRKTNVELSKPSKRHPNQLNIRAGAFSGTVFVESVYLGVMEKDGVIQEVIHFEQEELKRSVLLFRETPKHNPELSLPAGTIHLKSDPENIGEIKKFFEHREDIEVEKSDKWIANLIDRKDST